MENHIDEENTQEHKKATLRSWLYRWLASLEIQDIEESTLYESGGVERIEIIFKRG